jgi:SAM-dependent methyltransferase
VEPEALRQFLERFSPESRRRVSRLLEGPPGLPTVLALPAALRSFRLDPVACLEAFAREVRHVRLATKPPTRIAWLVVNDRGEGLDAAEVEAVLGAHASIEMLEQVAAESDESRTLAIGILREDLMGLWAAIPDDACPSEGGVARALEALCEAGLPVAAVALSGPTAAAWHAEPHARAATALRRLIAGASTSLALHVPAIRTRAALGDDIAAVTRLAADSPPLWVAVKGCLAEEPALAELLAARGVAADASVGPWCATPGGRRALAGATAYAPQPFDLRSPAARPRPGWIVETVRVPLGHVVPSLTERWFAPLTALRPEWCDRFDPRLRQLLDYHRMQAYHAEMATSVDLAQRYAEYRVYNWPAPDPSRRTTLIDIGELRRASVVHSAVRRLGRLLAWNQPWRRVVGAVEFLGAARAEALERQNGSIRAVLEEQAAAHVYLSTVPAEESLRPDVRWFADALPTQLGRTLEIGSGPGQLARHLRPRSRLYVCCDASHALLHDAPRPGACADIHRLPFAASCFDTVVANNVLEHAYDPLACLRELRRVLSRGGRLHAFVPLDGLNPRHEIRSHLWKADRRSVELALSAAGLRLAESGVVDIYELGVAGAFPSCEGKVGWFVAARDDEGPEGAA